MSRYHCSTVFCFSIYLLPVLFFMLSPLTTTITEQWLSLLHHLSFCLSICLFITVLVSASSCGWHEFLRTIFFSLKTLTNYCSFLPKSCTEQTETNVSIIYRNVLGHDLSSDVSSAPSVRRTHVYLLHAQLFRSQQNVSSSHLKHSSCRWNL